MVPITPVEAVAENVLRSGALACAGVALVKSVLALASAAPKKITVDFQKCIDVV
jgi:hypothetical protein